MAVFAASCGSDSKTSSTTAAPVSTDASTETTGASPETTGASTETTGASPETTASADTKAPDTSVAADVLGTANAATGDPILIGVINEGGGDTVNQQSENTLAGIKIAASYANDYLGGIAGHPIQIESCGNKNTPAGATDCANQLLEKHINAYIDPYSGFEAEIVNVLAPAGVPMIVSGASTQEGLTTPGVFAISGGYPGVLGGFAIDAKASGVKKFAMLVTDVPAATGAATALGGIVFTKEGVEYTTVPVPLGTADFTPMLQTAIAGGADAVAATGDATFCASFLQAYDTLALTAAKYVISTCLDPTVIEAAGSTLAGSKVATNRAPGPDDAIFAATVAKYGDSGVEVNTNGGVADGWASVMNVANLFKGYTGAIDSASLLAAVKAAKDIEIPLSNDLSFSCDGTAITILANVCSAQFQMATIDDKGGLSDFTKVDAGEAYAP